MSKGPPKGVVVGRYDPELKTDIYSTVSSPRQVERDGYLDIPPEAQAIVIWFHGAGSLNANGGVFWQEMNALVEHGVASIGFDLPFHGNGPRSDEFRQAPHLMKWIDAIVSRYRQTGKKVLLVGHSFGPQLILEYLSRYRNGADGAVLLAPGRYSRRMLEFYRTGAMDFLQRHYEDRGDHYSPEGDLWEEQVTAQLTFMHRPPSKVPLWAIVGELDQWTVDVDEPRALKAHFPEMKLSVVPGHDHFSLFNAKLGGLPRDVRDGRLFFFDNSQNPPETDMRFSTAAIVDFLRSGVGLAERIPLEPRRKERSDARDACILFNVNPVFRRIVSGNVCAEEDAWAEGAMRRWEAERQNILDEIMAGIPVHHADYYDSGREIGGETAKEFTDRVLALRAKERRTREEQRVYLRDRERLLSDLKKFLGEGAGKTPPVGFGVPRRAESGPVGKNFWTRRTEDAVLVARTDLGGWFQRGVGPASFRGEGTIRRFQALGERALAVTVGALKGDPYKSLRTEHRRALEKLRALKAEMDVTAGTVLSIGAGTMVLPMFSLFNGTDRVIALSGRPFGGIRKKYITKGGLADGQMAAVYGSEHEGEGADFINQVIAGLGARRIYGVYYFSLDADGRKNYINADSNSGDAGVFANAEIEFQYADGGRKILEVIRADFVSTAEEVKRYIEGVSLGVIYGGRRATAFETDPATLSYYYHLMQVKGALWAGGHRERIDLPYYGRMGEPQAFAFLNTQGAKEYGSGQWVFYIARDGDIRSAWRYRETMEGEREDFEVRLSGLADHAPETSPRRPDLRQTHSEEWNSDQIFTLDGK